MGWFMVACWIAAGVWGYRYRLAAEARAKQAQADLRASAQKRADAMIAQRVAELQAEQVDGDDGRLLYVDDLFPGEPQG